MRCLALLLLLLGSAAEIGHIYGQTASDDDPNVIVHETLINETTITTTRTRPSQQNQLPEQDTILLQQQLSQLPSPTTASPSSSSSSSSTSPPFSSTSTSKSSSLNSSESSLQCDCDPIGSVNGTCSTRLTLSNSFLSSLLFNSSPAKSSSNNTTTTATTTTITTTSNGDPSTANYQCNCQPGVTGVRCEKCAPLNYGFSSSGCQPCDCDPVGSTSNQCDLITGQCTCKSNIIGRRCERCRDGMHNKEIGCVECDTCYQIVELGVDHHRRRLKELDDMIRAIENDPSMVKDPDFERRLLELMTRVAHMLRQAEAGAALESTLLSQLEALAARVRKVLESAGAIERHLVSMRPQLDAGMANITQAEQLLKRIQDELGAARTHLQTEGVAALEKAKQRAERMGQQSEQLTRLAKESRQLADQHELDAGKINETTLAALQQSNEAYKLAKDAVQTQEANAKNLAALRAQIDKATDLLVRMRKMGAEANSEARRSYEEALALFTLINALQLAPVDAARLRQNATEARDAALRLIKDLEEFNARHKQLLDATNVRLHDLKSLLAEAQRQQQITDAELTDIDKTVANARDAVRQADHTLKEAQDTLATLKKFDQQVNESKQEALEALKRIPAIRGAIGEAENKTREAAAKLDSALDDATDARDIAIAATKLANETSVEATRIRAEAQELRVRLVQLRAQANELADAIKAAGSAISHYEALALADGQAAARALEQANQAAASARNASDTAKHLLQLLAPLLAGIDNIDTIDGAKLGQLEDELAKVRQKFKDVDLAGKTNALLAFRDRQKQIMSDYAQLIDWLVREVAQIKDIRDSLPDKCFRRERLEPPMHDTENDN